MRALALAFVLVLAVAASAVAQELTLSAAISMKEAVEQIGRQFVAGHPGTTLRFNFGSSGELQKQIEAGAPVDSFAVGSAISDASPIDFTGDLKEIDGRPIAKRGRIPGLTENRRLKQVDLSA